jgi:hypothetical protein
VYTIAAGGLAQASGREAMGRRDGEKTKIGMVAPRVLSEIQSRLAPTS